MKVNSYVNLNGNWVKIDSYVNLNGTWVKVDSCYVKFELKVGES